MQVAIGSDKLNLIVLGGVGAPSFATRVNLWQTPNVSGENGGVLRIATTATYYHRTFACELEQGKTDFRA